MIYETILFKIFEKMIYFLFIISLFIYILNIAHIPGSLLHKSCTTCLFPFATEMVLPTHKPIPHSAISPIFWGTTFLHN